MGEIPYTYYIGECVFDEITKHAVVGIFAIKEPDDTLEILSSLSAVDLYIRHSLTIHFSISACLGMPLPSEIIAKLTADHSTVLEAFIQSLPQVKILFFEIGSNASDGTNALMQVLVQIAKKLDRYVACLGVAPALFESNIGINRFNQTWNVIKNTANEFSVFDFESAESLKNITVKEFFKLRAKKILNQIAEKENGYSGFHYGYRKVSKLESLYCHDRSLKWRKNLIEIENEINKIHPIPDFLKINRCIES